VRTEHGDQAETDHGARFYRRGIGLVAIDEQDAYAQVPGATRMLDRLASLLDGTAARA
jgi:hypothetical protein